MNTKMKQVFTQTTIALFSMSTAYASTYDLKPGCEIQEYKDSQWISGAHPAISDTNLEPEFKNGRAEFTLNDRRYSTAEDCLINTENRDDFHPKPKREKRDHVYFSVLAGAFKPLTNSSGANTLFGYGGRFGVNVGHIGAGSLALGLDYHTATYSSTDSTSGIAASSSWNEYLLQVIFRDIAGRF